MSISAETIIQPLEKASSINADAASDRRADVDLKQARVAAFLQENGCDGLLVLDPDNFSWLTSGGSARGVLDPAEVPALYFSPEQRWALAGNVDSQRLFDEELDGLGFQLKEWPWHWGRERLLVELCNGRNVACDSSFGDCKPVGFQLAKMRRSLSPYEQACLRALGFIVSHAIEATCRTLEPNQIEREIAGQVSHRLLHRGAWPMMLGVAADGRSRLYRHFGFTKAPIAQNCVVMAAARKYGLCVQASRSVTLGPPDQALAQEQDAACKITATYVASSWPDAMPAQVLAAGRRVYQVSGFEHDWADCPPGHVTGRALVEMGLTPTAEELFQAGWAVTWQASVGGAISCDTFLITEKGPELVTPTEMWPLKRIRVQGADFIRPFLLQR